MKATRNGATLAENDENVVVEGNHYFPHESMHEECFVDSDTHTICPWKGKASYRTIEVAGQSNPDAARYYPAPKMPPRRSRTASRSGTVSGSRTDR